MKFEISYAEIQKRLEVDTGRPVQLSWLRAAKRDLRLVDGKHWIKEGDLKSSPVLWSEAGYKQLLEIRLDGLAKANLIQPRRQRRPPQFGGKDGR
jgi:hypothetical protein